MEPAGDYQRALLISALFCRLFAYVAGPEEGRYIQCERPSKSAAPGRYVPHTVRGVKV